MEDLYFLDLDTKTVDPNLPKDAKLYSWVVINVECSLTENTVVAVNMVGTKRSFYCQDTYMQPTKRQTNKQTNT